MKFTIKNLCGYTANKTPMRAAKTEQSINNKRVRFTFVGESTESVGNFAEWIVSTIFDGSKPTENLIEYGYQYVYTRWGREKQWLKYDTPKKEYIFCGGDGKQSKSLQLNKSQYDFAVWVTENFNTLDEALKADADYTEKLRLTEEEKERQAAEQEAEEQRIKAEKEQYKNHALSEAEKLLNTKISDLYKEIFTKCYGSDFQLRNYNGLMLYICAKEIENPLAKDMLIHWLYNDNKGSIKFFEIVSGCKLPKTYKSRVAYIERLTQDQISLIEC